jgi:hypothetical protein
MHFLLTAPTTTWPVAAYAAAMPEEIIVDEPYVLVRAEPGIPCIIVQLHAFANRHQFKQFMNAGLAYYKEHSQPNRHWGWIADARHMSAIPQEVQQWLADDWNGQACQAGLQEMSIVPSTNIMGRLAMQQYAEKAVAQPERYVLQPVYYESLEEAKRCVAQRCNTLSAKPTTARSARLRG